MLQDYFKEVISVNVVPSIDFLIDWYTVLYFVVLLIQLVSIYSNSKKDKNYFAFANIIFLVIFSYLYLSKYYRLK